MVFLTLATAAAPSLIIAPAAPASGRALHVHLDGRVGILHKGQLAARIGTGLADGAQDHGGVRMSSPWLMARPAPPVIRRDDSAPRRYLLAPQVTTVFPRRRTRRSELEIRPGVRAQG